MFPSLLKLTGAAVALLISSTAMLGTSLQMQAWVFEPQQRADGVPDRRFLPELWRSLKDTRVLWWDLLGSSEQPLHRIQRCAWSWLIVSSFVATAGSLVSLMLTALGYGVRGYLAVDLVVVALFARNGRVNRSHGWHEWGNLQLSMGAALLGLAVLVVITNAFNIF